MNSVEQAYNEWSLQYDKNENKTRDLEGVALREMLGGMDFGSVLEIGCGTGKNTAWFAARAAGVTAVDLSANMLAVAREKVLSEAVTFHQADILEPWDFVHSEYDLVTFSLVLEHIEDLDSIFNKAWAALKPGGFLYIGELHPFKQYTGSKARYATEDGEKVVPCFTHHISQFIQPVLQRRFSLKDVREYFDPGETGSPPRILALLMVKAT